MDELNRSDCVIKRDQLEDIIKVILEYADKQIAASKDIIADINFYIGHHGSNGEIKLLIDANKCHFRIDVTKIMHKGGIFIGSREKLISAIMKLQSKFDAISVNYFQGAETIEQINYYFAD